MINRLGKTFGPGASVSGQILFVFGIVISFFSLKGMILLLTGAFIGFTSTSARLDGVKRRIRYSTDIFGFIPVGKWIDCLEDMHISMRRINRQWTMNSQSNKTVDLDESGWELILFSGDGKPVAPLGKTKSHDEAVILKNKMEALLVLKDFESTLDT